MVALLLQPLERSEDLVEGVGDGVMLARKR